MLDREVVKEIIEEELEEVNIPKDVKIDKLTEAFCQYTENDYYAWLKDNLHSFFYDGDDGIDWSNVKMKIGNYISKDCM
jgi:hypothetical protein